MNKFKSVVLLGILYVGSQVGFSGGNTNEVDGMRQVQQLQNQFKDEIAVAEQLQARANEGQEQLEGLSPSSISFMIFLFDKNTKGLPYSEELQQRREELAMMTTREQVGGETKRQGVINKIICMYDDTGKAMPDQQRWKLQYEDMAGVRQELDLQKLISEVMSHVRKNCDGKMSLEELKELQQKLESLEYEEVKEQYVKYTKPCIIKLFEKNTEGLPPSNESLQEILDMNTYEATCQGYNKQLTIDAVIYRFNRSIEGLPPSEQQKLQKKLRKKLQGMTYEQVIEELDKQDIIGNKISQYIKGTLGNRYIKDIGVMPVEQLRELCTDGL